MVVGRVDELVERTGIAESHTAELEGVARPGVRGTELESSDMSSAT